jgi:hypothetical protein
MVKKDTVPPRVQIVTERLAYVQSPRVFRLNLVIEPITSRTVIARAIFPCQA